MIAWLLLVATALAAPDEAALARQRQRVDEAAAAVAAARSDGLRRATVAERMSAYRAEAERLAALEAELAAARADPADAAWLARRDAVTRVREALATGEQDDDARTELGAWLDPLADRVALLQQALDSASAGLPREVRAGILRDVVEQAEAVAVAATYDATRAEEEADRAELRARALRRRGMPGVGGDLLAEREAQRMDAVARLAQSREEAALALARTASRQWAAALAALEESP